MEGLFSLLVFGVLFFLMMRFGCGSHISHGGCGHPHGKHAEHDEHGATSNSGTYTWKQIERICNGFRADAKKCICG